MKTKKLKPYEHEQIYAGVPFAVPKGVKFKLACCHCGLVHEVVVEDVPESVYSNSAYLTMRENASYTKRYRKANNEELICQPTIPTSRPTQGHSSRRNPKSSS